MTCNIAHYSEEGKRKYTTDDIEALKAQFRTDNGTDEIISKGGRDMAYERFCDELGKLIDECEPIALQCAKCAPDDHEGHFCRCEGRNIKLGRLLRAAGMSEWQKRAALREEEK